MCPAAMGAVARYRVLSHILSDFNPFFLFQVFTSDTSIFGLCRSTCHGVAYLPADPVASAKERLSGISIDFGCQPCASALTALA